MLTFASSSTTVPSALTEVRVEARFDDGTRLVVVKDPFGVSSSAGSVGLTAPPAEDELEISNESATAIGLTSHIHLAEVNPRLRLDRARAFGMRPAIPTGETVWILPGRSVLLPATGIRGARVVVGNTGLVDGSLDDESVRTAALLALRECGFLDVVDGVPRGDRASAESAVPAVIRRLGHVDRDGQS